MFRADGREVLGFFICPLRPFPSPYSHFKDPSGGRVHRVVLRPANRLFSGQQKSTPSGVLILPVI